MALQEGLEEAFDVMTSNISEVVNVLPQPIAAPFEYLILIAKILGIVAILYIIYAVINAFFNYKKKKILERLEEKIDALDKKVDALVKNKDKKKEDSSKVGKSEKIEKKG